MQQPFLDPSIITSMLNTFQKNLDIYEIPLLSYEDARIIFDNDQIKMLDIILDKLEPIQPNLTKYTSDTYQLVTLQSPSNATSHQQKFARTTKDVDVAFNRMAGQLKADTGKKIMIASGYRSPVYHALLLCGILYRNDFDLDKTLRHIQPPDYSEHQDIENPAIDISDVDQSLSNEAFIAEIYPWLAKNAKQYGFIETYPQIQHHMIWEPWHWKLA